MGLIASGARELVIGRSTRSQTSGLSNPAQWLFDAWTTQTAAGVPVSTEGSLTYAPVYAAVRLIAQSVAGLPLITYQRLEPRGKRRALEHPLYPLLHGRWTQELTSYDARLFMVASLLLWGNAYAAKINWGTEAAQLVPMRPDRVTPKREGRGLFYYWSNPDGSAVRFDRSEILHVRNLSTDGVLGLSIVGLAREGIAAAMAAERYGARFFANNATPRGVLTHPMTISDAARERIEKSWRESHQGVDRAHRTAILEEGLTYTQLGMTNEDAQFLESRKFSVTEIARWFGVPPHKIGDLDKATFSNIEEQSQEFVSDAVLPWVVNWEQALLRDVFSAEDVRRGFFPEFLLNGLLRAKLQDRFMAYAQGIQWGWLSANDVRELENMNPREHGDAYLQPLNMIESGTSPFPTGDPDPEDEEEERARRARRLLAPEAARHEARARRSAESRRRTCRACRPIFEDLARRILRREKRDVMKAARQLLPTEAPDAMISWLSSFYEVEHRTFVASEALPPFTTLAGAVSAEAIDDLGVAPDRFQVEPLVQAIAGAFAARWTGSSRGQLEKVLRGRLSTSDEAIAALEGRFGEWDEGRPERTGARESVQAGNFITKSVFVAAGVSKLRWVAFGDTCPMCLRLDGKVVSIEGSFLDAGSSFEGQDGETSIVPRTAIGHPPLHRGCDCQIIPG